MAGVVASEMTLQAAVDATWLQRRQSGRKLHMEFQELDADHSGCYVLSGK